MDKKKITAALAAVAMVMKTREEALLSSAPVTAGPKTEPALIPQPAARPLNVWGISGRQTHMQANAMMQLRMFK